MKKVLFTVAAVLTLSAASFAQKGGIKVGVGVDVNIPSGDFSSADQADANTGFGPSIKGMYGVSDAGSITLTAAMSFHKNKTTSDLKYNLFNIMAGYRHSFTGFYVEPQIGYTNFTAKYSPTSYKESGSGFAWAIGAGYEYKGLDLSVRYQSQSISALDQLTSGSTTIPYIGFRVGYNFSLGGGAAKEKK